MEINWDLKVALVNHYGSQILASRHLKIPEGRLSKLIRGHVTPTERERKALRRALGTDRAGKLLGQTTNDDKNRRTVTA